MHGFKVVFRTQPGIAISAEAQAAGTRVAARALSLFDSEWMRRLHGLALKRRATLEGFDYLDAGVLEYALFKAFEAAFPENGGLPPPPLTRNAFVVQIIDT